MIAALSFRGLLLAVARAGVLAAFAAAAGAQGYPSKPIRLLLPFPPGAPSDIVGRVIAQKLAEQLGQNVVPDNRAGAGGNLAFGQLAKSPPDGHMLAITSPSIAISPALYAKLPFDALRDFAPVARIATIENVLVVHPSVPAKSLRQFVTLVRAQPGKINYGSGGAGTTNHIANELLKYTEKLNMVHVPYKGATLATLAAVSGEVDQVIVSVASGLPLIQDRKVRALVVLSQKRVAALPDVPTSKESGYGEFLMSIWYGLLAPAGTPREIVSRLHQEVVRALDTPEMKSRMATLGIDPWPGTPEQMGELIRAETARYAVIIRAAGIKQE